MAARMRTIDQAYEYLKQEDPESCIAKTAIRRLCQAGKLPGVVKIGRKYLINLDMLEHYLTGAVVDES